MVNRPIGPKVSCNLDFFCEEYRILLVKKKVAFDWNINTIYSAKTIKLSILAVHHRVRDIDLQLSALSD
jgi:hypothetical protein